MRLNCRPTCECLNGRFGVRPAPRSVNRLDVPMSHPSPVERLMARLLARAFKAFPEPYFKRPLLRAAREAVAQAGETGCALLVLPELFAELALAAMLQTEYLRLGRF